VTENPEEGRVIPHQVSHQGLIRTEKILGFRKRGGSWVSEFGVFWKILSESLVEYADLLVERRQFFTKLSFGLAVALCGRFAHRSHQPTIEAPPLRDDILVISHGLGQLFVASREPHTYAGDCTVLPPYNWSTWFEIFNDDVDVLGWQGSDIPMRMY
jgi:hypothetical protein